MAKERRPNGHSHAHSLHGISAPNFNLESEISSSDSELSVGWTPNDTNAWLDQGEKNRSTIAAHILQDVQHVHALFLFVVIVVVVQMPCHSEKDAVDLRNELNGVLANVATRLRQRAVRTSEGASASGSGSDGIGSASAAGSSRAELVGTRPHSLSS